MTGAGRTVLQLRLDHAVTIVMESDVQVRIQGPIDFDSGDGHDPVVIDPARFSDDGVPAALIRALMMATCRRLAYTSRGALQAEFAAGVVLRVDPSDAYEAWTVSGPGSGLAACSVGGKVVVWPGSIVEDATHST